MGNDRMQRPPLPSLRTRAGEFLRDPGFIFNTGYLGTFATLIPLLGPVPLAIMSLNWVLGAAVLAYKKKLLPDSWDRAVTAACENKPAGKFLARNNAALAINGSFLLTSGLVTMGLAVGQVVFQPASLVAILTGKAAFSSLLALGFGSSNLKKASELDNVPVRLFQAVPVFDNIKSEVVVAVASLASCLMTGGWSLMAAPLIFFGLKQGEKKATNPQSAVFRFTRFLAVSPCSCLPRGIRNRLYRQHPLTLSRGAMGCALFFSVAVGAGKFIARSVAAGAPDANYGDFATLGNIMHGSATVRLYHLTDSACGECLKDFAASTKSPSGTASGAAPASMEKSAPKPADPGVPNPKL